MDWVLRILLFLHIGGAIVAFGPVFAFMILGPMIGREPAHANFGLRFQKAVSSRLVLPLAIFQGITGVLIIWYAKLDLLSTTWLLVAIVLYLIALTISFTVLIPTADKLIAATSGPPPQPPPGAPPPSGPPPHIAALVKRGRMFGMINAILIVLIVFLMVTKPF